MMANSGQMAFLESHPHKPFKPGTQLDRVHRAMRGSGWLTLEVIAKKADIPETTVGSRIRDLRKPRGYEHRIRVKQVPRTGGLHVYRMEEKHGKD